MPVSPVIEAVGLTKKFAVPVRQAGFGSALRSLVRPVYETKTAVEDVGLAVEHGELVALLGPNGAGKSTTIKMLTGILTPTAGTLRVAGIVPHADRTANARNVGAVFGQRTQLWFDLPARESFRVLRDIFGIEPSAYRTRLAELDDLLELSSFWDTRVRHLSLGQRVRCDLAAALLHDPQVVFLDEPTIGMDAVAKEQVREFLRNRVEQRGKTVLLTTHDMTEVDRLAERVVLINHGRIVFDGALEDLRAAHSGGWRVRVTLDAAVPGIAVEGARVVAEAGATYTFAPDGPAPIDRRDLVRHLVAHYGIEDMAAEQVDLEDVMRAAYRASAGSSPEQAAAVRAVA
jgi:ABC-2 type transport system ATP-binding protein